MPPYNEFLKFLCDLGCDFANILFAMAVTAFFSWSKEIEIYWCFTTLVFLINSMLYIGHLIFLFFCPSCQGWTWLFMLAVLFFDCLIYFNCQDQLQFRSEVNVIDQCSSFVLKNGAGTISLILLNSILSYVSKTNGLKGEYTTLINLLTAFAALLVSAWYTFQDFKKLFRRDSVQAFSSPSDSPPFERISQPQANLEHEFRASNYNLHNLIEKRRRSNAQ